jgi:hypothetical protein
MLDKGLSKTGIKLEKKKKIKVAEMFFKKDDEDLFKDFVQKEYPPVGN